MFFKRAATVACSASRNFSTSSVARKDIVKEIYLREINSYKPKPAAKDAHVGSVKNYSLPPSPKAPALPADLAAALAEYDAAEPTLASAAPAKNAAATSEEAGSGAQEFLAFLEQDLPKEEAHH